VDLKDLKDSPSDSIPGLNDRLMAWLPTMIEHRCSVVNARFFQRLRDGTYPAHILEHVTIELQKPGRHAVGYGRARESVEEVCIGSWCATATRGWRAPACSPRANWSGRHLRQALRRAQKFANCASWPTACAWAPARPPSPAAADARGIPVRRLNEGSLVQLGQGAKQRRIWTAETDPPSAG